MNGGGVFKACFGAYTTFEASCDRCYDLSPTIDPSRDNWSHLPQLRWLMRKRRLQR